MRWKIANETHSAELAIIISSNKRKWNNYFIKNAHKIPLNLVRTNQKRQGSSAIHMSHVYQNCQRMNRLSWTG